MGQHVCIISVIATVLSPRKVDVCRPARSRARTDTTLLQQGTEQHELIVSCRCPACAPRGKLVSFWEPGYGPLENVLLLRTFGCPLNGFIFCSVCTRTR